MKVALIGAGRMGNAMGGRVAGAATTSLSSTARGRVWGTRPGVSAPKSPSARRTRQISAGSLATATLGLVRARACGLRERSSTCRPSRIPVITEPLFNFAKSKDHTDLYLPYSAFECG